jgi:hypothetical protein
MAGAYIFAVSLRFAADEENEAHEITEEDP